MPVGAFAGRIAHVLAAAGLAAALAASAEAQVNPFRRTATTLTPQDLGMLEASERKMLDLADAKVGSSDAWSNAATGNSGIVTVTKTYAWQKMPCRQVIHQIFEAAKRDEKRLAFDWCKLPSGEWKRRF